MYLEGQGTPESRLEEVGKRIGTTIGQMAQKSMVLDDAQAPS